MTTIQEQPKEYYNKLFTRSADMSRYHAIHDEISRIVGSAKILDIACGTGELAKRVPNYYGFDFSEDGVRIANHPNVWIGDAYERKNYAGEYDYMVCTESLEHLDDFRVILNIPVGQKTIFSVPSFPDPAHLRTYTEEFLRDRYSDYFEIEKITRFNWHDRRWTLGAESSVYILLVQAIRK